VFGPPDRFPFAVESNYPPPDVPFQKHEMAMRSTGADRAVLVQPAPYGTDNRALADALRQGKGRLRGVAVATAAVSDAALAEMHAAGVRGLRFVEMKNPDGRGRYKGCVGVDQLELLAPRMREFGWHAQIWADGETCVRLASVLEPLGLPLVFDHMAGIDIMRGPDAPLFVTLLRLLAAGHIWIKLTVCRVSQRAPDYSDARSFHDAMVQANAKRLLWGSDFPFVRMGERAPNLRRLAETFLTWVPDAEARTHILVNNPMALYGFAQG
jgi:predicted TIM-barrel fold metal-dependent hydrolase